MKPESVFVFGLLPCLPVLASSGPGRSTPPNQPAVASREVIDAAPFNAEAALAAKNGVTWPRSATQYIFHRLGIGEKLPLRFQLAVESQDGQAASI